MSKVRLRASLVLALSAAATAAAPNPTAPLGDDTVKTAGVLRDQVLASSKASSWVRELTERAGPRLAGSPGDRAAVAVALEMLKAAGFSNVRAEKVTVPVWARTAESGEVTSPVSQQLALTALGGSVATPEGGLEAEIVRVQSWEQLDARKDDVKGRIVFFDVPTERKTDFSGYGKSVLYRAIGASRAARYGAIGVVIRSIGTDNNRLPHTGGMAYLPDIPRIPAAALSIPDADLVAFLASRGPVKIHFTLACGDRPDAESANVIGEVVGREKPEEIVVIGGHLDSWDLGRGAIDDGAGCGIAIEAARQIAALPRRPRRTIRVVLFANEENGLAGGKAYAADHAKELDLHSAAIEADEGAGSATGLSWNAGGSAAAAIAQIAAVLQPLGATKMVNEGEGGADISRMLLSGVPVIGLSQDATRYFDIHHTANDTFDKIVAKEIDQAAAAAAVTAWCLADAPQLLERIPAEKRKLPW